VEGVVCQESDIQENEMKNFDLADAGKVLLVKQNGKLSAIGAKCSHYGAMLSTGALGDGRVRCPWHGACFNLTTGDIEDFPGQDSVPCYQVTVDQGQVKVRAKKSELTSNKRTKPMAKRDPKDERTFVVVGGGPSGAICAETLRQEGYTGRLVMVCKENALPYDRIKLSKRMDLLAGDNALRPSTFYEEHDIEVMLGVEVTRVDTGAKELHCSNGYSLKFDKVYVATGSKAKKAPIPGADLKNVVVVRTHAHTEDINSKLTPDSHVVVLGKWSLRVEFRESGKRVS
jgi:apoptosis-inducing factor 3